MQCENCKAKVDHTMLFCWSCGTPLAKKDVHDHKERTKSVERSTNALHTENKQSIVENEQAREETNRDVGGRMVAEANNERVATETNNIQVDKTARDTTSDTSNEAQEQIAKEQVAASSTVTRTSTSAESVQQQSRETSDVVATGGVQQQRSIDAKENVTASDVQRQNNSTMHEPEVTENTNQANSSTNAVNHTVNFSEQVKGTFLQATERINRMVGEEGQIDLNLRDVFSDIFKKHSKQEAEKLFITGTELTTPKEKDISTSWPKPWLFARIFVVFAITYLLLSISAYTFDNVYAIPGLIVIGSFAVPFSLLIFFWETNAPRNISIYEIAKMFFIGGAASLVTTLILYSIFPVGAELTYGGAIVVGIVEELGKLVIIAYFIYNQNSKYILNGLLIGAAIGAGFAAFESAGYAFAFGLMYGDDVMTEVIFLRAWLAIGTHTVWSAIAGGALVYVKGAKQLSSDTFLNVKFIQLFAVPVILHAVWDMPLYALHNFNLLFIILIVIAWIFIFTFINAGLKQIGRLHHGT